MPWLADLVGAHRPSVTTAMGDLARSGAISRRDSGEWVLHGAPPEQLRNHKLVAALS
jgi:CRP/FNR family cyclic AMP-dependent transcriptional regulator